MLKKYLRKLYNCCEQPADKNYIEYQRKREHITSKWANKKNETNTTKQSINILLPALW